MLTIPEGPYRPGRRIRREASSVGPTPPPPVPLVLTAAAYDPGEWQVVLTFDRAIDIAEIDVAAFIVNDGTYTAEMFTGDEGGASLLAPNIMRLNLLWIGSATEPGALLSVSAENGIIAIDDGGAWAGVTDLTLPWAT